MKKLLSLLMTLMIGIGIFTLVGGVNTVKAAEDDIASGTTGTCTWVIDKDGALTVYPINGEEGQMESSTSGSGPWYNYRDKIKKVVFEPGVKTGAGCYKLFYYLTECTEIDLKNLDTSASTNMESMFYGCSQITDLDVSHFNTARVTDMDYMFGGCRQLKALDVSNFDTSNVTSMDGMFCLCNELVSLNVSGLDTSNVTNMHSMFSSDYKLAALDLSGFNTSKVTDLSSMFNGCNQIKQLDVSGFDTSNVIHMQAMFMECQTIASLDISGFDTSKVIDMTNMFRKCINLTSLDLSGFKTSEVTAMQNMFNQCSSLTDLDLSAFDTSKVTSMNNMFGFCSKLKRLDISGFNTSKVTNMLDMFSSCGSLASVKLGEHFSFVGNGNNNRKAILPYPSRVGCTGKWIREDKVYGPYTPFELRDNYVSEMAGVWITEIGETPYAVFDETTGTLNFVRAIEAHDNGSTETVHSISGGEYTGTIFIVPDNNMYNQDASTWKSVASQVKKVIFIDEIKPYRIDGWFTNFYNCENYDLNKLNTSNVTNMSKLFACYSPNSNMVCNTLDISEFDMSNVNNTYMMFTGMNHLEKIKLGDKNRFVDDTFLIGIVSDDTIHTGKWIRDDKAYGPYTPAELRENYTSEMAGTWVRELIPTEYTISFVAGENGTGAMQSVNAPVKEDFTIPANQFVAFGYEFDHWNDGNGKTYTDKGTIPANTYAADTKVTLTAVWKKRDTSLSWDGNEATFSIRGGEQAVLDNIPAGTSYQVYELMPDGWVLVQQENASGVIEALEESAAAFWNKYQPGVTTVQFSGLKNLDGRPAEAGKFTFELYEGDTLVDTATTQDGGFIQFKVIEYDAAGDHVYTIREVDPNDDTIDYDTHEETVEVSVTDNGDGTLSSEVTYDDDGIVFSNATRPGTLRITKNATNGTSQNANDEFTIEIEFRNESGMPINDSIYWYIEGDSSPSEISGGNQE